MKFVTECDRDEVGFTMYVILGQVQTYLSKILSLF